MSYTKEQLLDIFQSNAIDLREYGTGDIGISCPFCGNEKFKCWVKGAVFHCFRCEERGSVKFLFRKLGIKPGQVHLSMEDLRAKVLKQDKFKAFGKERLRPKLEAMNFPPEFKELHKKDKSHSAKLAFRLLDRRGLDWEDVRKWQIGYASAGKYLQHIIFPVKNEDFLNVTFQARQYIGPKDTKNPFDDGTTYSRTDTLYGIQFMKKGNSIVLVEGPFDAIYLNKVFELLGMPFTALALLGHQITRVQIMYLADFLPSAIFVMLDSDVKKEARVMGQELASWFEIPVYITELEYGDPDDLTPEEVLENLQNSSRARVMIRSNEEGRLKRS